MRQLLIVAVFFVSCQNKSTSNYFAFEVLDKALLQSNKQIRSSSMTIMKSLEERLSDPVYQTKASIWYPKVQMVHKLVTDVYDLIDEMKSSIKKNAGLKEGYEEDFEKYSKAAVRSMANRSGKLLYEKLMALKKSLLEVDPQINQQFANSLAIVPQQSGTIEEQKENFARTFFHDLPAIGALAILSKFQQDISISENKIVAFGHEQSTSIVLDHHWFKPVIFQSSSILKPGEELTITAGIGEYLQNNKMEVSMGRKKILLNDFSIAEYRMKAPASAGNYRVPVKITYPDADGNWMVVDRIIRYTVRE